MKKIINFIDNISITQFLLIWLPVILLLSSIIVYIMWAIEFCNDLEKYDIQF